MKERITITIDDAMLKELDDQVDGVIIKNRSHAIELNLAKTLQKKQITQAVILAGGSYEVEQEGENLPSFMVRINNRPILEHNILMLRRQGIKDLILAIGYKSEMVREYFGNGEEFGVNITYIDDSDAPLGTSGILLKAAKDIRGTFVVCNGDELKKIDIKEMFEYHKKQGTLSTIALTTVSNPKDYGVVVLNGNRVYSYIEKPKGDVPTNLINAGLYIFEPEVLSHAPQGFGRLEKDVFPKLAQKEELAGYVFFGEWQDVRDTEGLEKAISKWK